MTPAGSDQPAFAQPGREWGVMVIALALVVALLYTQARDSRRRVLSLKSKSTEYSEYFKRVKPEYDAAFALCDKLTHMAQTDGDAARILQQHGIQIDYRPNAPLRR